MPRSSLVVLLIYTLVVHHVYVQLIGAVVPSSTGRCLHMLLWFSMDFRAIFVSRTGSCVENETDAYSYK